MATGIEISTNFINFGQAFKRITELCFILNKKYAPYTRWLNRTYRQLPKYVDRIAPMLAASNHTILKGTNLMFPVDLDGLFPTTVGAKTERRLPINNTVLDVTITCIGTDKYNLVVIEQSTNLEYLRRMGLQQAVIQLNWQMFREGQFQRMP